MTSAAGIVTASGEERARLVRVERLSALGITRERPPILVHRIPSQAGVDGLLGLDFLRESRLTIDFRAGTMEVT